MTLCLATPDNGYDPLPPRCILNAGHPPGTDHTAHKPATGPAHTWPNTETPEEAEDAA